MINRCMLEQTSFGVVLIHEGAEALGPLAEPYLIGTSAKIVQSQSLPEERINIVAIGVERFRILSFQETIEQYLIGRVEYFPMQTKDALALVDTSRTLKRWMQVYLSALAEVGESKIDSTQFPEDPERLAYISASILQLTNEKKQQILSSEYVEDLVDLMTINYRREIALIKVQSPKNILRQGSFSMN